MCGPGLLELVLPAPTALTALASALHGDVHLRPRVLRTVGGSATTCRTHGGGEGVLGGGWKGPKGRNKGNWRARQTKARAGAVDASVMARDQVTSRIAEQEEVCFEHQSLAHRTFVFLHAARELSC